VEDLFKHQSPVHQIHLRDLRFPFPVAFLDVPVREQNWRRLEEDLEELALFLRLRNGYPWVGYSRCSTHPRVTIGEFSNCPTYPPTHLGVAHARIGSVTVNR
jgi:hypothetical protein